MQETPAAAADRRLHRILDVRSIYLEPAVTAYPRGCEILARFPDVERIEVPSHWNIPELHGNPDAAEDWLRNKREILVLGVRKSFPIRPNGRSADWIASSFASGCAMACAYCVAAGTLITTPQGVVPAEQIKEGDTVVAFDSEAGQLRDAIVAGTNFRDVERVLEIVVAGRVLRATAEHPIMTRSGWVEAGDLSNDSEILLADEALYFASPERITPLDEPTRVYNFHVPGPQSYLANGIVTHNCYVPRRKGYANPVTTFVNIDAICGAVERHASRLGRKLEPNQVDPELWVYDIGENSDCSVDAAISDNVRDLVELFTRLPNAKASFATKFVNRELLQYDPQGKTRVRFSLMPQSVARIVDVRTTPIAERIAAINDFVAAGYEVHINLSPVIVYEGWERDYALLCDEIDAALSPQAKAQLKAEVIFLTHNASLHEVNLRWHPRAEELLWRPDLQEAKVSEMGGDNVRYRHGWKGRQVASLRRLLATRLPYCEVRYAF